LRYWFASWFLHEQGYTVTASDLNEEMLTIAKNKFPEISFEKQDLRSLHLKECDAIITIFNAVAHMTPDEFQMVMNQIYNSLKPGGIYIFDIFNAAFMEQNFIDYEFIDRAVEFEGKKFVRFNHNSYDSDRNLMHVNQRTYIQEGLGKPEVKKEVWDMQIYSVQQLQNMLEKAGFSVVTKQNLKEEVLDEQNDLNMLLVAKK